LIITAAFGRLRHAFIIKASNTGRVAVSVTLLLFGDPHSTVEALVRNTKAHGHFHHIVPTELEAEKVECSTVEHPTFCLSQARSD
jgi:hypothetical protein